MLSLAMLRVRPSQIWPQFENDFLIEWRGCSAILNRGYRGASLCPEIKPTETCTLGWRDQTAADGSDLEFLGDRV
jgi:hypothetical protein